MSASTNRPPRSTTRSPIVASATSGMAMTSRTPEIRLILRMQEIEAPHTHWFQLADRRRPDPPHRLPRGSRQQRGLRPRFPASLVDKSESVADGRVHHRRGLRRPAQRVFTLPRSRPRVAASAPKQPAVNVPAGYQRGPGAGYLRRRRRRPVHRHAVPRRQDHRSGQGLAPHDRDLQQLPLRRWGAGPRTSATCFLDFGDGRARLRARHRDDGPPRCSRSNASNATTRGSIRRSAATCSWSTGSTSDEPRPRRMWAIPAARDAPRYPAGHATTAVPIADPARIRALMIDELRK